MKYFYDFLGALFVVLALIFIIVPGPSVVFLPAALLCFAINHPDARKPLRRTQVMFKEGCYKLDQLFKK